MGRWGWERPPNYPTISLLKYWWIRTCHCFFACTNWVCCQHSSSIPRVKTNNKSYLRAEAVAAAKVTWRTGFVASNDRGDRFDSAIFASRQRMEYFERDRYLTARKTDRQTTTEGRTTCPVQWSWILICVNFLGIFSDDDHWSEGRFHTQFFWFNCCVNNRDSDMLFVCSSGEWVRTYVWMYLWYAVSLPESIW